MKKFSEIEYVRPDMVAEQERIKEYTEALKGVRSYEELRGLFMEEKEREDIWATMAEVAQVRYTVDTRDSFYEGEVQFWNETIPMMHLLIQKAEKVILESPFIKQFAEEFGDFFVKNMEVGQKLADDCIVEDLIEEGNLTQQYSKITANASTKFRGETCNFYGLLKAMQSTDREMRKEAMTAWGDLYEEISGELDALYDKMVPLRDKIAKKLGFSSYIEFIYLSYGRYDYTAEDVAKFRAQVKEKIVPLCLELRKEQEKRLGVDKLHYYDEELIFPEGNAVPEGTTAEMVAKAQKMYHELSKKTGEFFDFMVEHELFDLETKPGKQTGGYCTFLNTFKAPFIFSNFNGTSVDVDVLTHEAGHAFEAYTAAKQIPFMDMVFPTSEVAEIHSMSMEHFTYPWMEAFFGKKADDYRYAHLMNAMEVIPYMVCVDEFQHKVFENIGMTAKERREVWHQLEQNYMPWRNYDGHKFLEKGGFWMQKQHIFVNPFYYIDYALAQICAFQFFERSKKEPEQAWADYYRLCQAGGSKGYFELLEMAGLKNPFADGTVENVVEELRPYLKRKIKYTIRPVREEDLKKVAEVEAVCFPAAEAAGYEDFIERYQTCQNSFFVAETEEGEIAGFCNGCCADTDYLADALYHDASLHNPDGDYQMIFGLDVNPKFQKQGIGEALMRHMVKSAGERGKKAVVLTCKDHMIPFYKRIGYEYIELSDSTHGGAAWHKMMYRLKK